MPTHSEESVAEVANTSQQKYFQAGDYLSGGLAILMDLHCLSPAQLREPAEKKTVYTLFRLNQLIE